MADPEVRQLGYKLIREREHRRLRASFLGKGGLLRFVKHFWHVLEPQTKFVDGWPLEAICDHLQAITDGRITRLLSNVCPGFMKSLLTDVFWPAHEWGPMNMAYLRYVTFSYSSTLTERDNRRFGALVSSVEYQELYGDRVQIVKLGDKMVSNRRTGWKLASSVGGVGTGERGDRIICVSGETKIATEDGEVRIDQIIQGEKQLSIVGYDHECDILRWQKIEAHEKNPGGALLEIRHETGSFRCTIDHPVYVEGVGYIRADQIKQGMVLWSLRAHAVPALRSNHSAQAEPCEEVLRQAMPLCLRKDKGHSRQQQAVRGVQNDGLYTSRPPRSAEGAMLLQPQVPRSIQSWSEQPSISDGTSISDLQTMSENIHEEYRRGRSPQRSMLFSKMFHASSLGDGRIEGAQVTTLDLPDVLEGVQAKDGQKGILFPAVCGDEPFEENAGRREWPLCSWASEQPIPKGMEQKTQGDYPHQGWEPMPIVSAYSGIGREAAGRTSYRLHEGKPEANEPYHAMPILPQQASWREEAAAYVEKTTVLSVESAGFAAETFNLRVSPCHNYFANGVLVHNCDDPNNVKEAESEVIRSETARWFRESMSNRLNDMDKGAIVVIMQRLHNEDVSGVILDKGMAYEHLLIPMEYDYDRQTDENGDPVQTSIGWYDPRYDAGGADEIDGTLAWPERFPEHVVDAIKNDMGPYAWHGQYQQSPSPRGGGIFKREWWQLWESADGRFPVFDYVMASLDSAFTEQERNDPSALTIWGIFQNQEGQNRAMLVHAWRKHLEFSGPRMPPLPNESKGQWIVRTQSKWGLMEWVKHTCERFKVDNLLIEAKASGMSAAQELQNRYGRLDFGVQLCPVKGSKEARAYAAQPTFSQLLVYAPARDWAEDVISEMEAFPKHKFDDLTDSATQAIKFLRDSGMLNTDAESRANEVEEQSEWLRRHKKGGVANHYFE